MLVGKRSLIFQVFPRGSQGFVTLTDIVCPKKTLNGIEAGSAWNFWMRIVSLFQSLVFTSEIRGLVTNIMNRVAKLEGLAKVF